MRRRDLAGGAGTLRRRRPQVPGDPGTFQATAVLNGCVNSEGVPIADLLLHADFVRGLARDLLGEVDGDDLTQEVWVAALRRPPRHTESVRGWLATLVQNLLHNRRRTERRRRAREQSVPIPGPIPSPASILERELVRERLVRAVLQLDEPFRSVVLLRYYEDLPAPAIAQRLGVPAATVRTRLRRGLERLRGDLDGDDRGAWRPALVGWATTLGKEAAVAVAGGMVMKKVACGLVAAVLLVSFGLFVSWFGERDPGMSNPSVVVAESAPLPQREALVADGAVRQAAVVDAGVVDATAVAVMVADRGRGSIVGDLVDEHDMPIADIAVVAEPAVGTLPPRMQVRDDRVGSWTARTDAAGYFRIDGVDAGPMRVHAELGGDRRAQALVVVGRAAVEGPVRLQAQAADPGDRLRVIAMRDGQPAPHTAVEVFAWSARDTTANQFADPRTEPIARGSTDGFGIWEVRGLALRSGVLLGKAADGWIGRSDFDITNGAGDGATGIDLKVALAPAAALRGGFSGAEGLDLDGAVVSLHALALAHPYGAGGGVRFDAPVRQGEFFFANLPAGGYAVTLAAPGNVRLVVLPVGEGGDALPNSARARRVSLSAGEQQRTDLAVAAGGRVRGVVRSDGRPVQGARVRAVFAPQTSNFPAGFLLRGAHVWRLDSAWENAPNDPMTHVEVLTDARGVYELRSLQPGKHRIEVVANGLAYDRRLDVLVQDGQVVELTHELAPAGILQVAAIGLTYVGVTAVGRTEPTMLAVVPGEHVTFPGLAAGHYEVARFHSDSHVAPVVLGTAEVQAGRTTWMDLRQASVVSVVTGRVTSAGAPCVGARVSLHPATAATDAFGAFRLALGYRISRALWLPQMSVRHAGIETSVGLQPVGSADEVSVDVDLGARHLAIAAVDVDEVPIAAVIELSGGAPVGEAPGPQQARGTYALRAGPPVSWGPWPAWPLRGEVTFADGLKLPVELTAAADSLRIVRPPTSAVQVRVLRAGQPQRRAAVVVLRWTGMGEPPSGTDFGESFTSHLAETDEAGMAMVCVPAGELLVYAYQGGGNAPRQRVHAPARATAKVEVVLP